jgi:F-type H+-transporting ATPase subunit b
MLVQLDPGVIIWTALTFGLLLLLLSKTAWKPILKALDTREESIRQSIERAEEAKTESERFLGESRKSISEAEARAQQVINEARELAEKLKSESVARTNAETNKMLEKAREEIERDKQQAISQLHGLVAELAVKAAEKILDEAIDESRQKKLVENFLNSLQKN